MNSKFLTKSFTTGGVLVLVAISASMSFGINDAGHRTVVQYPTGKTYVKFAAGIYPKFFGKATTYNDVITFDFDKTDAEGEASLDSAGISVRYQDGGTGTIFGKARFNLPNDEVSMLQVHKDFRTNQGIAYKLIKTVTEESQNLTAGLMTSEEAYAEKRGTFSQWSRDQLSGGKFVTEIKTVRADDETGKTVLKNIPVIAYGQDGFPKRVESDFKKYGVTLSGYQIVDWGFEEKTLDQISKKREATMAIITSKAEAERAKQDEITAEATGKKNVIIAKYGEEVEKEKAIVVAEREKQVAVIAAEKLVSVAEQKKFEAEQKRFAAVEYKQEQILRGEGDAAYKQLVLEADGALQQKLATYETVMGRFAAEFGKQKWVPEVQMGAVSGDRSGGNEAANLINLLTAGTLKDLGLDMKIKSGTTKDLGLDMKIKSGTTINKQ